MNIAGVVRAFDKQGEWIKIRRLTGTQRVPFEVRCRGFVSVGRIYELIDLVQTSMDEIRVTSIEMNQKQWPLPPRAGDQVIYEDTNKTVIIQDSADVAVFDGGEVVYRFKAKG